MGQTAGDARQVDEEILVARLHKLRRPGYGEKLGAGWRFVWLVLYYPVSGVVKLRYRNLERFPQHGPVIVVTNHVSHIDPFLIAKFVLDAGRVPRILAQESIFAVPAGGWGMRTIGHIPAKRATAGAGQRPVPLGARRGEEVGMTKVAVFGAGSWGTAFAKVLVDAGNEVTVWARRPELAAVINDGHQNDDYLPGVALPAGLTATHD